MNTPAEVAALPMTLDLSVSRGAVAAAASVSTLTGAVAALPVGRLIEKYGGRSTLGTGPLTAICLAGEGLGQGVSIVARPALIADVFGITRFASITAAMFVPVALARTGGPLVAATVGSHHFVTFAGLLAVFGSVSPVPLIHRKGTMT